MGSVSARIRSSRGASSTRTASAGRWQGVHEALQKRAAAQNAFYLYDTLQNGESQAPNHQEHRNLYATAAKRSRFFTVAPGKTGLDEETHGQVEVGFRVTSRGPLPAPS